MTKDKILVLLAYALMCFVLPTASPAQAFQIYPGAKLDERTTAEVARSPASKGLHVRVYMTADTFEKVRAFYAGLYHEAPPINPPKSQTLKIQWAHFTVDGAKELWKSSYWLKVQRPYVGGRADNGMPDYNNVRDLTVIEVVQKK